MHQPHDSVVLWSTSGHEFTATVIVFWDSFAVECCAVRLLVVKQQVARELGEALWEEEEGKQET